MIVIGFPQTPSPPEHKNTIQGVIDIWDIFFFKCDCAHLTRALDADLGAVMKAAESFDWSRINFILEVWDFQDSPTRSVALSNPSKPCIILAIYSGVCRYGSVHVI